MIISFEARKRGLPLFVIPSTCLILALLFESRWQYFLGIGLALILFLGSYGAGKRLSFLFFKTADQTLFFPLGIGSVLAISFALAQFPIMPIIFYCIWGALAILGFFEIPVLNYRIGRSYFWAAPFALFGIWQALTPEIHSATLEYSLGLAHQYLVLGKWTVFPDSVYTAFPPFGQVLTLLFSGMKSDSGVRLFCLVLLFQIVSVLVGLLRWLITEPVIGGGNGRDYEQQVDLLYMSKTELMVIPLLMLPAAWLSIRLGPADLLASLFFCGGIATVVKEFPALSSRYRVTAALLFAFALWTKYASVLYVAFLPLLWFSLCDWRMSRENWKQIGILMLLIFVFWTPFLVRNTLTLGDPLYPALDGILSDLNWSPSQSQLLDNDLFTGRSPGFAKVLLTPFLLLFQPAQYGYAGGTGAVILGSLILYIFSRKMRSVNQILIYVLVCYMAWLFTSHDFTQFLPPAFLVFLTSYFGFRHFAIRRPNYLAAVWGACALVSILILLSASPIGNCIRPGESAELYLSRRLDYYPFAKRLSGDRNSGKVWMLGETRTAYFHIPLIVSSQYNRDPVLTDLEKITSPERIDSYCRQKGIRFILFNQRQFVRRYGPQGIVKLSEEESAVVQEFLDRHTKLIQVSGQVTLFEVKNRDNW